MRVNFINYLTFQCLLVLITTGNQIVYLIILGDSFPPFLSALNQHFMGGRMHWLFLNRYCKKIDYIFNKKK